MEVWLAISAFNDYEVSDQGNIRNNSGRRLKQRNINSGYRVVDLYRDKKKYTRLVHRLVATAFKPNLFCLPEVNHLDNDKSNNMASNLDWTTRVGNLDHAREFGNWRNAEWCTSTTKVRGVTPHKDGGFVARRTVDGVRQYLGYFKTIEAAAAAVKAKQ